MTDLTKPFLLPRFGAFLPTRILPGPMEGVTTGEFLRVMTRRGWIRAWWTPFLRISVAIPRAARLRNWLSPYCETGLPILTQLMGTDTDRLVRAAMGLRKEGAVGIDLNCACPSPIVVGNGAGGARLSHPEWIAETVVALKESLDCPVGVKVRMGLESPSEFSERIAPALREAAPDFVTVHFRTVREGYCGVPDGLERLATARRLLPDIPLVGSGDLYTPQDVLNMRDRCGVDAVAPARGLLRNPRLLRDIEETLAGSLPPPWTTAEKYEFLEEFRVGVVPVGMILQVAANLFGRDVVDFARCVQKYVDHKRLP